MGSHEMRQILLDLSEHFGRDWKNIGRRLGLTEPTLQNIESDNDRQAERAYQTLEIWRQRTGTRDLWERLEAALRAAKRVDLVDDFYPRFRDTFVPTANPRIPQTPLRKTTSREEEIMIKHLEDTYRKKNKVPLVPWVGRSGKIVNVNIQTVYTRLELLVAIDSADLPLTYPLDLNHLFREVKSPSSKAGISENNNNTCEPNETLDGEEGENLMEPSSRVVARGRTGSGKTTFLLKLSNDWARKQGPLKDAKAVFLLPLKKLDHQSNLGEAIVDHFCLKEVFEPEFIEQFINDNEENVVVLLDGYDEFKGKGLDPINCGNIVKMLRNEFLPGVRLLVTTRPGRVSDFLELEDHITDEYRHLVITGFTSSDIDDYIKKVLKERPALADKLLNYLAENHLKTELASLPLMCCAFCQLTKLTNGMDFKEMNTINNLFNKLVKCLIKYHPRAKEQRQPGKPTFRPTSGLVCPEEETTDDATVGKDTRHHAAQHALQRECTSEDLLLDIGKVALSGFMKSQEEELVFCEKDFQCCKLRPEDVIRQGCRSGILLRDGEAEYKPTRYEDFEINQTDCEEFHVHNITFVLKIFQEKFAGMYLAHIAKGTEEERCQFTSYVRGITSLQRAIDLGNVLMFACGGSIDAARTVVDHIIQLHLSEEESVKLFMKGKLHYSVCQKIQRQIEFCLQLNFESQSKGSLNDVLKPLLCGCTNIRLVGISSYVTKSLGYFLEFSQVGDGIPVESLELVRLHLNSSSEFREFLNTFPGLESDVTGSLSKRRRKKKKGDGEPLTEERRRELLRKGVTESKNIPKYLLQRPDDTFITVLPLWEQVNRMQKSEWSFGPIIKGLEKSHIGELILNGVKVDRDEEWESLFTILSNPSSASLKRLTLSMNGIHEDLLAKVAPVLRSQSNLRYLKLSGNEVGEPILDALGNIPPMEHLETLILENTDMDSESIEQLGDLLPKFPALTTLDIRRNKGTDDTAIGSVLGNLHCCKQLQRLMISLYDVTEKGLAELLTRVDILRNLKELQLVHTPRPNEVLKYVSSFLPCMTHLEDLRISASAPNKPNFQVPPTAVTYENAVKFSGAITKAPLLKFLSILYVSFGAESFLFLLERCMEEKEKNKLQTLRFSEHCIPNEREANRPVRLAKERGLLRPWV